jgi:hypothetical protein
MGGPYPYKKNALSPIPIKRMGMGWGRLLELDLGAP